MALWWLLRAAVARVGLVGGQRAGCNAGTLTARGLGGSCREVAAAARDVQAKGRLQPWNSKGCRPEGVVAAASNALTREGYVRGKVPHLRWSQAPPRPWRRPGSADIYVYTCICIYVYRHIRLRKTVQRTLSTANVNKNIQRRLASPGLVHSEIWPSRSHLGALVIWV